MPVLEHYQYSLLNSCPLAEINDVLAAQEAAKLQVRGSGWRCKLCEKLFRAESFLDIHMHKRHEGTVQAGAKVCLASFCDVFECRQHKVFTASIAREERERKRREAGDVTRTVSARRSSDDDYDDEERHLPGRHCNPAKQSKFKHSCHALFERCFRPRDAEDTTSTTLLSLFEAEFCSKLTCDEAERARARAAPLARDAVDTSLTKLYWIGTAVVLVVLALFYLGVFLYRRDLSYKPDLRRLDDSRRSGFLSSFKSAASQKEKAY